MEWLNYFLLCDTIVNGLAMLYILHHLERNIRINWLVKDEINVSSLLLFFVLISAFLSQVIEGVGFAKAITTNTSGPLLNIYHLVPSLIMVLFTTIVVLVLAFVFFKKWQVKLIYVDDSIKLKIVKDK